MLLAAIPALAIAHEAFAQHFIAFAAAITLVAATMGPQADITTVGQLLRRFSLAIVFPILWMALQIVPLPISSLANPVWSTTSTALGDASLAGYVSIDPGATLRSLILYLTMLALAVSATIVARDRQQAETIFLVLSTVTTFMSAEILVGRLDAFAGMIPSAGGPAAASFVAMAALATLANGAIIVMAIERHLSRRGRENSSSAPLIIQFALALCGLAIAVAAIKSQAPPSIQATTALGLAAIFYIAIVRRLGLRSWPSVILFAVFAVIVVAVVVPRLKTTASTELAGLATSSTAQSLALAERAMANTPRLGNGVGTFNALVPVYRDFDTAPSLEPPSTAMSIAIEWGKPALAILAVFVLQLFVSSFRGAVRRGRDSYFASAAAAGVLVMFGEAFFDQSLLALTVQIVAAVMIGLGVSQSVGRTSGLK